MPDLAWLLVFLLFAAWQGAGEEAAKTPAHSDTTMCVEPASSQFPESPGSHHGRQALLQLGGGSRSQRQGWGRKGCSEPSRGHPVLPLLPIPRARAQRSTG